MMRLWSVPSSIRTGVYKRCLKLWSARRRGSIRRSLRGEWVYPVFWLLASAFGVWFVKKFDPAQVGAVFHGWTLQTAIAILTAIPSGFFTFVKDVLSLWPFVIILYGLITLIRWALQARKRVVLEEFVDYTNERPRDGKTMPLVDGLASLLVVRLSRLHNLYLDVNEQRAIPTSVWVNHSIDATIDVGNLTEFLQDAVSVQSELSLGPLKIPVGLLFSFLGHVVQGPRIIGGLHKDKDLYILTAQRFDSKQSFSWQVEGPIRAGQDGLLENESLKSMVEELAFRMFTDLSLSGSVRWRATAKFSEGLRAYRECLRSPKDRKNNLELAEKSFIETLAEDQKFDMAYYNLGVVYTELGQSKAAESAFMDAICQNRASWNAYYALAMIRFQSTKEAHDRARLNNSADQSIQDEARRTNPGEDCASDQVRLDEVKPEDKARLKLQYESVIELCQRVIDLNHGKAKAINVAKAYQLKASAEDQVFDLTQSNRKAALKSRKKAINCSWQALCKAELPKQDVDYSEDTGIGQLETLASICLANQAESRLHLGEKLPANANQVDVRKRKRDLERAKVLLNQALSLKHSDPDYHAYYHYLSGETYFELGQIYQSNEYRCNAVCQYEQAIRIIPDRADFWASLALAHASLEDKNTLDACEKVLDYAPFASHDILRVALNTTKKVACLLEHSKTLHDHETLRRIEIMQSFLDKQKEISEIVENWKGGEYTVEDFVTALEEKLKEFNKHTTAESGKDPIVDKEKRAWGYALMALELGHLDDGTAKAQSHKEHSNHIGHETAYAQGFLSVGNLDASDAILKKITQHHRQAIKQLEAVLVELDQADVKGDDWERGQIRRVLGLLYLDLGEPANAENCFREAIRHLEKKYFSEFKPYKLRVLLARALLAQDTQKKILQALQEVKQGLAMNPLDHREREVLGDVHFRLKEFDRAICAWQDALLWRNARLREPATPTLYYKIGNAHVEIARHHYDLKLRNQALEEAVEYLKKALDLYRCDQKEQKGLTSYLLGTIYMALGKYWEAIAYLRLSQMFEFALLSATFYLGYAYLKNREYDESLVQFESLLRKSEQRKSQLIETVVEADLRVSVVEADPRVHIFLTHGEILALAKWGKATVYSERDVKLEDALNLIIEALQHIRELQQAKPEVQLLFPARYEDCMGWLLFKLGKFDRAIKCLNSALNQAAHAQIYLHLALVYESKMQQLDNTAKIETLVKQIRAYCQHVKELDINGEWGQQINDLQLCLQEKSQEVQRMKIPPPEQLAQKNGSNPVQNLLKEA